MNTMHSSYTGRAPRTLDSSSFGPYARGPITEPAQPMHPADKVVVLASCLAGVALLIIVLMGCAGLLPN